VFLPQSATRLEAPLIGTTQSSAECVSSVWHEHADWCATSPFVRIPVKYQWLPLILLPVRETVRGWQATNDDTHLLDQEASTMRKYPQLPPTPERRLYLVPGQ